jgi:hypothetical protein
MGHRVSAQHAGKHEVRESKRHGRGSCSGASDRDHDVCPGRRCWSGAVTRFSAPTGPTARLSPRSPACYPCAAASGCSLPRPRSCAGTANSSPTPGPYPTSTTTHTPGTGRRPDHR